MFCMIFVSFLGSYQILLAKPLLDVLFDQIAYTQREAEVDNKILERQARLEKDVEDNEKDPNLVKRAEIWLGKVRYPILNAMYARFYGSSFFNTDELRNTDILLKKLKTQDDELSRVIWDDLTTQTQANIQNTPETTWSENQNQKFIGELNTFISREDLYEILNPHYQNHFKEKTINYIKERADDSSYPQANRAMMEDIWPQAMKADEPASLYRYASENKTKTLRLIVAILLSAVIIKGVFEGIYSYQYGYSLSKATTEMKSDLFRHLMNMDLKFLNKKSVGFLMSRVNSDVGNLQNITKMVIKNAIMQIMRMIALFSVLLFLNSRMTIVVIVLIVPIILVLGYFARKLKKISKKSKQRGDILSSVMNESFGNIRLIKALSCEDREFKRFHIHITKLWRYGMKNTIMNLISSPTIEFFGVLGVSAVLLWGGYVVYTAKESAMHMEPSTFLTYVGVLVMFYSPVRKLSKMNINWQNGKVSGERVQEILDVQPAITDPPEGEALAPIEHIQRGLAVRNLSFRYEDKVVLRNLNVEFPAGTTTAIVGRSGSGKTTLGNLLLRLYDPIEGHIELDGNDIRKYRLRDLRAHFGIVTQDTVLFNDTIATNVAYGPIEGPIDEQRMIEAAKAANAHDFILALDGGQGYQTPVGPGGSALSGGQRQRIAIARAFYGSPDILLFDEATSSLDNESEGSVQEAIESLMHHRTVIIIAHRLSTIMHADNIIVLDDGKLIEQGNHAELMAKGGKYAALYRLGEFDTNDD